MMCGAMYIYILYIDVVKLSVACLVGILNNVLMFGSTAYVTCTVSSKSFLPLQRSGNYYINTLIFYSSVVASVD
jgi:hypothetical protein